MNAKVKQIECVYIPITNPYESAEWYQKNLGLELRNPVTEDQVQLRVGEQQAIFLIKTKECSTLNFIEVGGIEMSVITLEVTDIEEIYSNMKINGVRIEGINESEGCGDFFNVFDPDGNKISIWGGWK
ncbi:MAG: VOC family protein [Candidatus Pristimantibacillus lignocellulolyticus]|uniref:VOC family protein n=1 Tax=Candidatus Pristimantibacillus lignocellulolyticus TaxID=2994561 RepID=A0A9J6ZCQ7_9BACL|nr:MAG: VOC family protein [Candidatus Pristimantibacillus lignocellulolyticus]